VGGVLRAGVLGLRRGLSFVRVLQAMDGVEVAAVADLDSGLVERVCREHGIAQGCSTLAELLQHSLDFVVIATPPALHVAHTIEALDHGVHVLCEVPAVVRLEECETLLAAVEHSGRHYMLAENCCYWAFVDTVRKLRARGDFGAIFYSEAEYIHNIPQLRRDAQGQPTWRATLEPITYITHSLGPIIWITGQYPTEVSCYGTAEHFEPGVTDLHVAIFRMTDGSVARVTISFANAHWGHHRFAFFGTRASLDTGSVGLDEPKFWSPALPNIAAPVRLPLGTNFPQAPRAATLGGHGTAEWYMLQDFLRALREDRAPPIDVYDALMYSVPGLCALEAARTGRPVAIPQYQQRRQKTSYPVH
jgi:predicted dehydrogenase